MLQFTVYYCNLTGSIKRKKKVKKERKKGKTKDEKN
jgi:hypothetical protein